MRFVAEDAQPKYRLLVLSRNLTHDNTWDIVVRLDSESVADERLEVNDPLVALLRWLPEHVHHISAGRASRVQSLAEEIAHVSWERPEDVESVSFHVVGVPGHDALSLHAGRHLVISPFVEDDGLARATRGHQKVPTLISRQETLDALSDDALDGVDAYTLAADVDLPTTDETGEDEPDVPLLHGLHAKVYVLEPTDKWTKARVLLGSSNATTPGLTGNIEFLVDVFGRRDRLGIDRILPPDAESRNGLRPLIEPYVRQPPLDREDERTRRRLQGTLRSIAAIEHLVEIVDDTTSADGHTYRATISTSVDYPSTKASVSVALLTRRASTADVDRRPHLVVHHLPPADISPCVIVTASEDDVTESTIVLSRLIGAPEGRLDAVIARQIDDPEKFMRLLMLMLSLGNPSELAALPAAHRGSDNGGGSLDITTSGVLELVLRGLSTGGAGIDDLDHLITKVLDDDVLPAGFREFWSQVSQARRLLEDTR
ncbi:phospholipase D family protein [Janibacter limosus]|uniref:phospholipase D family protein n=1 Tax=Janibacter limosus TaxID=53458 RepID=UPI0035D656E2|nr:phospholipase D family protein [Janibacter limosus]